MLANHKLRLYCYIALFGLIPVDFGNATPQEKIRSGFPSDSTPIHFSREDLKKVIQETLVLLKGEGVIRYKLHELRSYLQQLLQSDFVGDPTPFFEEFEKSYENRLDQLVVQRSLQYLESLEKSQSLISIVQSEFYRPVVDYFSTEYLEDLNGVVIAETVLDDNVNGQFQSPCAINQFVYLNGKFETKRFTNYRGPLTSINLPQHLKSADLTPLIESAFKKTIGTPWIIFINQDTAREQETLQNRIVTVAHEVRHILDYRNNPTEVCDFNKRTYERSRLREGAADRLREEAKDLVNSDHYRNDLISNTRIVMKRLPHLRFYEVYKTFEEAFKVSIETLVDSYSYYFSKMESRAYREENRFMRFQLHKNSSEAKKIQHSELALFRFTIDGQESKILIPLLPVYEEFLEHNSRSDEPIERRFVLGRP